MIVRTNNTVFSSKICVAPDRLVVAACEEKKVRFPVFEKYFCEKSVSNSLTFLSGFVLKLTRYSL